MGGGDAVPHTNGAGEGGSLRPLYAGARHERLRLFMWGRDGSMPSLLHAYAIGMAGQAC